MGLELAYLCSAILVTLGLIGVTDDAKAPRSHFLAAAGILLAIVATFADHWVSEYVGVVVSLLLGLVAGVLVSLRLRDQPLPQTVLLLSAIGALAAVFVAGAEIHKQGLKFETASAKVTEEWKGFSTAIQQSRGVETPKIVLPGSQALAMIISGLVGGFAGAAGGMAWLKRVQKELVKNFLKPEQPLPFIAGLTFAPLAFGCLVFLWPQRESLFWVMVVLSASLGYVVAMVLKRRDITFVCPLVNFGCGLAGAAAGLVIRNWLVVIAGGTVAGANAMLARAALLEIRGEAQPSETVTGEPTGAPVTAN